MANKTNVVGIEGAPFNLLRSWVDDRALPHLARHRDADVRRSLRMMVPIPTDVDGHDRTDPLASDAADRRIEKSRPFEYTGADDSTEIGDRSDVKDRLEELGER